MSSFEILKILLNYLRMENLFNFDDDIQKLKFVLDFRWNFYLVLIF